MASSLEKVRSRAVLAPKAAAIEGIGRFPIASGDGTKISIPMADVPSTGQRHRSFTDDPGRSRSIAFCCIHRIFEQQTAKTPDATALVFEGQQLTYSELNARANQVSHALLDLGIGREQLVALALERSPAMVIALLGILKAGGAYLPLDPAYPGERLAFILEDSGARILITQQTLRERFPTSLAHVAHVICLDAELASLARQPMTNPQQVSAPDHLAYVMFTSGSTGTPKGVAIEHRGVVRLVRSEGCLQFGRDEVFLQMAPLSFDASTLEIWAPLLNGGRLVLMPPGQPSLAEIGSALRAHKVTTLWLTAGLFHLMVEERLEDLVGLRRLFAGGEVLSVPHVQKAVAALGPCRVINGYGPTENTTFTTCYPVPSVAAIANSVPIGKPIAGTTAYVLDGNLEPVPVGVAGELYTGGAGVARGYWHRPELTAERFLPDRFSDTSGSRLYKTGDQARFLPDGNIEFLGRLDQQIKLRGFRIELGEIEAALASIPGLRESVVAVRGEGAARQLVAYVAAESSSVDELRRTLQKRLPNHMVPSAWVCLPSLPRTPHGKVDRQALPDPAHEPCARAPSDPPRTLLERQILKLWQEVLNRDGFGIHDNFFALGGQSLAAARLVSRLQQQLGLSVPIAALFETQTVALLAECITSRNGHSHVKDQPIPQGEPLDVLAPAFPRAYRASFSQRSFWFLDRMETNRSAHNLPSVWRLRGSLRLEALETALNQIVLRHDVLRTSFHFHGTALFQVIHDTQTMALRRLLLPANQAQADVDALIENELSTTFDLSHPPLLRALLIQLQPEDHILVITLHHIVSDGWSQAILHRELSAFYNAAARGEQPALQPLPRRFADFAAWQHRHLAGHRYQKLTAYWHAQLQELPALELPADYPRPATPTFQGDHLRFSFEPDLGRGLRHLCQRQGATLHMGLLALVATLLHCYSRQEDFAIGVPSWGRSHPDWESLIGFFVNTLVIRTSFQATPSFLTLLDQIRAVSLAAYDHQDLPFERLVESLQLERDPRRHPLFQVILQYIDLPEAQLDFEGLRAETMATRWSGGILDLNFQFQLHENAIHAELAYNTDLFSRARMQRLANDLQSLLQSLLRDPGDPVASHSFLTPAEEQESLLFPLTSVQRDIWFEQMLYPGTPIYNIAPYHRIKGQLDLDVFAQAVTRLVQETEVLRMKLAERNSFPFQSFPEMREIAMEFCDFSLETDPQQSALSAMQRSACRPFKMMEEPLFRYVVYKLSDNCHLWSQTYHHLVVDGWGCSLITQRVAALYNALLRGDPPPERPGVSYRDFIQADTAYFSSASISRHRQYWREKFATLPEPLLRPRGAPLGSELIPGDSHTWWLPRQIHQRLEALAQAHSSSVFHAWIALLYVYFTRTQNQEECIFRLPVLNRSSAAFKRTVGLFASVIPARFAFSLDQDFIGLMQVIAKNLRELYRYQQFPISEINRLARLFETDRKRLFEISLSFEKHDYAASFGPGDLCESFMLTHRHEQTPLSIFVREYSPDQDLQVDFTFNRAYFEPAEIARLQIRLGCLLESVLSNPRQLVTGLNLLPLEERHQLVHSWNKAVPPMSQESIHALFAWQVAQAPDAPAVLCRDEVLTYGELNARANQLAHALIDMGVGREELVALALERSPAMIVALLGILKAGGAYLPLDPAYPGERLAFILEDSGARILITQQTLRERFPSSLAHVICLDAELASLARQPMTNPQQVSAPDHLAYVMFTSGSTGTPKGVAIEHRGVVRLVRSEGCLQFGRDEVFLQMAPLSFDASTLEIWAPLLNGGRLVLMPPGQPSLAEIGSALRAHKVTTLWLTAGLFHLMVEERLEDLAGLRRLFAGGEVLSAPHVKKAVAALGPCRVINGYGPTENTTFTTCYPVPSVAAITNSVPIGKPIAGTTAYVLDGNLEPVPVGVAGELYTGGSGVARGYWHRPELTAERFLADPFSQTPGSRLYKTGDQARFLPDGNIEYIGRLDQQVKIRGFRVELAEIEALLGKHPAVQQVVVTTRETPKRGKVLVAYFVPGKSNVPHGPELAQYLRDKLPDYMVPAGFVVVDKMPLNGSGKLNGQALPEWSPIGEAKEDATTLPSTSLELQLAQIWERVLGVERIGVRQSFFDLGGHSLLAVRLIIEVNRKFQSELGVMALFQNPTVERLASALKQVCSAKGELGVLPLQEGEHGLPLYFLNVGTLHFHLASLLDKTQSIFITEVPSSEEALTARSRTNRLPSLAELASTHADLISSHRPAGSCLLAGYCFHGLLAFEVARQLQARGNTVNAVVLLDTPIWEPRGWKKILEWSQREGPRAVGQWVRNAWRKANAPLQPKLSKVRARWLGRDVAAGVPPTADNPATCLPWAIPSPIQIWAMERYRPEPLETRGILLLSEELAFDLSRRRATERARACFTKGLEIVAVPGNHGTMLKEPHIREVAARLNEILTSMRGK